MSKNLLCAIALVTWFAGPLHAAEKFVVVMDWLPSWKHAAFHLAKVKGWYDEAGLDVQIDDGSGSTNTVTQTALNKCDMGLASLSAMAVARSKGSDVVAVAAIMRKTTSVCSSTRGSALPTRASLRRRTRPFISRARAFNRCFRRSSGTSASMSRK
jgi:ABC-type nitrate/sulfonate/bicarbonate transport system substrate-binding protein